RRVVGTGGELALDPPQLEEVAGAFTAAPAVRLERGALAGRRFVEVQLEQGVAGGVPHRVPRSRRATAALSACVARWKRDLSVPCGEPVTSAISANDSSRLQRSTTTSRRQSGRSRRAAPGGAGRR